MADEVKVLWEGEVDGYRARLLSSGEVEATTHWHPEPWQRRPGGVFFWKVQLRALQAAAGEYLEAVDEHDNSLEQLERLQRAGTYDSDRGLFEAARDRVRAAYLRRIAAEAALRALLPIEKPAKGRTDG